MTSRRPAFHRRSRRPRLQIAPLEARVTPTLINWVGGSGNWTDTSHWSPAIVPAAGDEVIIGVNNATVTISADAQADSIAMTGSNDVLAISAGTLALVQASDITNLQMTGGAFASALLSTITGTASIGTATLLGQFRNDATLTLTGSPNLTDVSLANTGTILDGATIALSGNTTIDNQNLATFDVTFNGNVGFLNNVGVGTVLFHNAAGATLQRSGTGPASFDGVPFQNDAGATINVTAGTLLLNTTGTLAAGPIAVSAGGTLALYFASLALSGNFAPTGSGHIDAVGATLDLGGAAVGFNCPSGMLTVSDSTFQNGTLNNSGMLTVSNTTFQNGTLNNSGTLRVADASLLALSNLTLNNSGTITDGGLLNFSAGSTLNNLAGGTFDASFAGDFTFANNAAGAGNLFHNAGTLKRSGTGIAQLGGGLPFQGDAGATINVTAGTLLMNTTGTLAAGPLSIASGASLWFDTGTSLTLSGNFSSSGSGHIDFAAGTLSLGSGTVGFNFQPGVFTVSGSPALQSGTLNNTGTISFAGGSTPQLTGLTLNNTGTISDAGRLDFDGNTTVYNQSAGTFDASFAGDFTFANNAAGTGNLFRNAGTLKRSATGTAQFGGALPFQGDAGETVTVSAGTLLLNTGGSFAAGPISVAGGATLRFDTGTSLTLTGSYAPTGTGHVDVAAGTLSLGAGTVGFNFLAGMLTVSGTAALQNGTLTNTGAIQFAAGSTPALSNLTVNNSGTISDAGRLDLGGSAVVNNLSAGTFDVGIAGTGAFVNNAAGSGNLFHNAGTLKRSANGTADFGGVPFQNDAGGSIAVSTGTLLVNTTGTLAAGPTSVSGGAALQFNGSTSLTLSGNFAPTGGGQVNVTGGTLDLGGGTVGFNFPAGMLTLSGSPVVQNGTLNNTGTLGTAAGSTPLLAAVTLNNGGTIADGGQLSFNGGAVLNNQAAGLIDANFAGDYLFVNLAGGAGSTLHNAGMLRRSATGTAQVGGGLTLDNTGTVEVLAGTLDLAGPVTQVSGTTLTGGTWDVHSGATLLIPGAMITDSAGTVTLRGTASAPFGNLAGNSGTLNLIEGNTLTVVAGFTNSGSLTLGPASTLTVNGTFAQTSAGTTSFQLGGPPAGGQYGRVVASGAAALAGMAGFALTGGYTPTNGDAFTLLDFASHSGTFATYTGQVPTQGVLLTPVTSATNFGVNILVDHVAPTSSVTAFPRPTTDRPAFHVNWSGSDNVGGAGLATYDVYVSDNGGAFTPWLSGVTTTTAVYTGQLGHTYGFYTRATDLVGNVEAAPGTADATITVSRTLVPIGKKHTFTDTDGDTYTVSLSGPGTLNAVLLDPAGTGHGPLDYLLADGTTAKSSISVAVKKNKAGGDGVVTIGDVIGTGSLGLFTAPACDLVMGGFNFAGPVKAIKVRNVLTNDAALATPAIQVGGAATDKLAITVGRVQDQAVIQTPGVITRLAAGPVVSGTITASAFGAVSMSGGDFNGTLTSTTPAATLGKMPALASLKVTGGNFTGHVRILGKAGPITVAATKAGGGSIQGGTITASVIASLTVGKNFADAIVLAGADLGPDFAFGGGNDTFAAGTIGAVKVGGNVTGAVSLIGAGFSRVGGVNGIVGGTASSVASLTVGGTADANLHFAAGRFKATPKIGGKAIDPTADARFLL